MSRRTMDWGERKDVPPGMHDVAMRRVRFLFSVAATYERTSLAALFVSAYLQGIEDAAQAMDRSETSTNMTAMG